VLLAQGGAARFRVKDPAKERLERRRQYPYHRHLNLDMLEAVHLIAAMFIELPTLAHFNPSRKRQLSKTFRKLYENYMKQTFKGPPEKTSDLVMAAAEALLVGEWRLSVKYLTKLRMWKNMPNAAYVQALLTQQVKEAALRAYMLHFHSHYVSMSLSQLSEMFELTERVTQRTISKLMMNGQIQAAWDHGAVVTHAAVPTPMQKAAVLYAEKLGTFVDQNERLLDPRGTFYKDTRGENFSFDRDRNERFADRGGFGTRSVRFADRGDREGFTRYDRPAPISFGWK
jgi:translation initiation factor 3 subunit C